MHTTTTTTPPGLPSSKRPSWAQRHPFWVAFFGGFAAVAVLAAAFSAWRIADAPSSSPAPTARPTASAPAALHKGRHHHNARPVPAKTVYVTPPAPQAAAPAPAAQPPIQPGAYGPYLDELKRAGIVAPDQWAVQTANNLEAAWARGETEDQTNAEYLTPGGIYPQHLAAFNAIVHANFG